MQEFQPREGQQYAHTGNHSIDSKKTQIEKKKVKYESFSTYYYLSCL